jgi:hypothetical protein
VSADAAAASAADERFERAVLLYVLDIHPAYLTVAELVRALDARHAGDGHGAAAVELAVTRLTDFGLLHHSGGLVSPTIAAVRFSQLLA